MNRCRTPRRLHCRCIDRTWQKVEHLFGWIWVSLCPKWSVSKIWSLHPRSCSDLGVQLREPSQREEPECGEGRSQGERQEVEVNRDREVLQEDTRPHLHAPPMTSMEYLSALFQAEGSPVLTVKIIVCSDNWQICCTTRHSFSSDTRSYSFRGWISLWSHLSRLRLETQSSERRPHLMPRSPR